MQIPVQLALIPPFPQKGMTVEPLPDHIVPSAKLHGWKTGMVYGMHTTQVGTLVTIKGIVNGKEFSLVEFSDSIREKK